jgi:hypothetical protein
MKVSNIEIPLVGERDKWYRFFEILPGFLSWGTLALPAILSFISPTLAAYFIIGYLIIWFLKAVAMNVRMIQGYRLMKQHMALDWMKLLDELGDPKATFVEYEQGIEPKWHAKNLRSVLKRGVTLSKNEILHVVIIAAYNESRDVIEPTIESLLKSQYDKKKLLVFLAYEERGGEEIRKTARELCIDYADNFLHMEAVEHPKDLPNEVIGKGGNITYTGRRVAQYLSQNAIDFHSVIVTTLDSDNRPHPSYFASVTYAYIVCPDPVKTSFQPIPMFMNNIWDAPAPMRVIASGNSFWMLVQVLRPHMLRNFAAHSQSMQAVVDTDFWSVRTIVEDGHQYWRTYFRYNGAHDVHPILVPVYQDAVLTDKYVRTLKAQFIQLRRWAWGASDVAYVLHTGWRKENKVPKLDLFFKSVRLIDGHVSWATAPLLLLLAAFVPLYLSQDSSESLVANQLPLIASNIQTLAMAGFFVSIYLSIRLLPPKPARYRAHRRLFMLLQWALLPITTICYSAAAALYSQTRLMFGWYIGKFDVTEKAVKK